MREILYNIAILCALCIAVGAPIGLLWAWIEGRGNKKEKRVFTYSAPIPEFDYSEMKPIEDHDKKTCKVDCCILCYAKDTKEDKNGR